MNSRGNNGDYSRVWGATVRKNNIFLNLPNLISFARLLSVPLTVWLILNEIYVAAFWVFVGACVSDAADGFIAKKFHLQTELGRYLDPLADKALLVSVFLTLGHVGLMDTWLVILVVFRDVLIICGAVLSHLRDHNLSMRPKLVSKINTSVQFILVATVIFMSGEGISNILIIDMMAYLVATTTLLSGAAYVISWGQQAVELEPKE